MVNRRSILVTGATGTNGREIVRALAERGARVRAFVRQSEDAAALVARGAEIAVGDLDDPASVDAALEGVDRVVLLAANTLNQVGHERGVIDAATRAGVRHLMKFSAAGADPSAPALILRWHGEAEEHLKASGIPHTILRPVFFMQNLLAQKGTIASEGAFHLPMGTARPAAIDARDTAEAFAAVASSSAGTHLGKTYTLTGPEPIGFDEMAAVLSRVAGRPVRYVDVAPEAFRQSLLGWGQPEWLAAALDELFARLRAGDQSKPTDAVREITGRPARDFGAFAADHAEAFRAHAP